MERKKRIFALGFFDGVHLGHQALLRQCVQLARQTGCQSAAITFDRHPKALVWKEPPVLISTGADRHLLLKRFGMDYVRQFPVVPEVTGMPWEDFLQVLLEDGAAGFVCGDDFRFGWKGEGNALRLTEFCNARGLPCIIVPEQLIGGIRISSTYIRSRIEAGDMATAIRFLGHPYVLSGKVVREQMPLCRGICTCRLRFPPGLVVPRFGVYGCRALVDGVSCPAVTYVAHCPDEDGTITVEPWLPDWEGPLSGREILLEFHGYLRPEQDFSSEEALRAELERNLAETRRLISCTAS